MAVHTWPSPHTSTHTETSSSAGGSPKESFAEKHKVWHCCAAVPGHLGLLAFQPINITEFTRFLIQFHVFKYQKPLYIPPRSWAFPTASFRLLAVCEIQWGTRWVGIGSGPVDTFHPFCVISRPQYTHSTTSKPLRQPYQWHTVPATHAQQHANILPPNMATWPTWFGTDQYRSLAWQSAWHTSEGAFLLVCIQGLIRLWECLQGSIDTAHCLGRGT